MVAIHCVKWFTTCSCASSPTGSCPGLCSSKHVVVHKVEEPAHVVAKQLPARVNCPATCCVQNGWTDHIDTKLIALRVEVGIELVGVYLRPRGWQSAGVCPAKRSTHSRRAITQLFFSCLNRVACAGWLFELAKRARSSNKGTVHGFSLHWT